MQNTVNFFFQKVDNLSEFGIKFLLGVIYNFNRNIINAIYCNVDELLKVYLF